MARLLLFLLLSAFPFAAGAAVESPAQDKATHGIISAVFENDLFANSDRGYTNGVRLGWLSPDGDPPSWVERLADTLLPFAPEGQRRSSYAVGQNMYTPNDIRQFPPDSADRPYAGWLYFTGGIIADDGKKLDHYLVTAGVVGPLSHAEQTQKFIHHVVDSPQPRGWDYQLKNEPGLVLTWDRRWRNIHTLRLAGLETDVSPDIGFNLGNIFTDASAGLTLRLGQELPADYGPPRIRPSLPGSDFFLPTDHLGWYVFGGGEVRAVARNIFLDGNSFRDGPDVDKRNAVGIATAGLALTYGNARLSYTQVFSTREFKGQRSAPTFGGISLSVRY